MLKIEPVNIDVKAIEFCNKFINDKNIFKYIFGRNEYAKSIAENIEVDGFVDDFTSEKSFQNKPVLKTTEIPQNSLVVSVVVLGRNWMAMNKLIERGIEALDYFKFIKYSNLNIKPVEVFNDCKADIELNFSEYQNIYNQLKDEISKEMFEKIINFRVSGEMEYMKGIKFAQERQYFEDFLELKDEEVFVDAGGFEGETVVEFAKRCKKYKEIHIFEPDNRNLLKAKDNLSGYNKINFYEYGLSNEEKTLRFGSGSGASSKISEDGDVIIKVNTLDNLVKEKITFIKMDIEGAEKDAIDGAKQHILLDHPKMAICVYHKPDDFWKIPKQVLEIRNDYEIYLRHYNEGITETVMFFIPQK